jgi:hypothetical protein
MKKILYYDPHSHLDEEHFVTAGGHRYHLQMLKPGELSADGRWVFVMDSHCISRLPFFYPRERRVALLKESPTHTRHFDPAVLRRNFDLVLTHREDLIEQGAPFQRVDFSTNWAMRNPDALQDICKSKMVSFFGSIEHEREIEGYEFRRKVAQVLSGKTGVDLFGRGIRSVEHKTDGLVPYRFSVAMENSCENYYYTEKIIDCFFCDTVPLYWGCPTIGDIFDSRGMIIFKTVEQLLGILEELTDAKYQEMLPFVRENRARCVRLRLDSYDSYLTRCVEAAERYLPVPDRPMKPWQITKAAAGVRYAAARLNPIRKAHVE